MLAKLNAFALAGIDAVPVEVEVDAAPGVSKTVLVGLPELAVRESVHRIERALANLGYARPTGRTTINLAPADLRKDAGAFDLPIALGLLVDDAMIAIETMISRLEAGDNLGQAASYAWTSIAFPMLTGTLVTVAALSRLG